MQRLPAVLLVTGVVLAAGLTAPVAEAEFTNCLEEEQGSQTFIHIDPADGVQPFTNIFDLWVTQSVIDTWGMDGIREFMPHVIASDGSGVFPRLWQYFCIRDLDDRWDHVEFYYGAASSATSIRLQLDGDSATLHGGYGYGGIAIYFPASLWTPEQLAASRAIPHELGHLMEAANRHGTIGGWESECWATAAEIVVGVAPAGTENVTFHDGTFASTIGTAVPYRRYRFFNAYLHAHYAGDPGQDADDLIWQWIRSTSAGVPDSIGVPRYAHFAGLAAYLDTRSDIEGTDGSDRLGRLFHRAALALYANAPGFDAGQYGFGTVADARAIGMFEWFTDFTALRARVIPPDFEIGSGGLNPVTTTQYEDLADVDKTPACRTKPLRWSTWGTDYLVFRADPDYFATHPDTVLGVTFRGGDAWPTGRRLRIGTITYATAAELQFEQPIVKIEESIAEIELDGENQFAELAIDGFGGAVKAVVIVSTVVQDPVPTVNLQCRDISVTCWTPGGWMCSEPELPYELTYGFAPAVLNVPGAAWNTIQDAIDAAVPG